MATLAFSAIGAAMGGPVGGAIGALLGQQIDRSALAGSRREGPRLDELRVSTSSYGRAIPRNCGRLRAAGTIIWATDLVESSETSGGVTTYHYSVSFAVALSSRPLAGLGRIWADGNLLRGEDGALSFDVIATVSSSDGTSVVLNDVMFNMDRKKDPLGFFFTSGLGSRRSSSRSIDKLVSTKRPGNRCRRRYYC